MIRVRLKYSFDVHRYHHTRHPINNNACIYLQTKMGSADCPPPFTNNLPRRWYHQQKGIVYVRRIVLSYHTITFFICPPPINCPYATQSV